MLTNKPDFFPPSLTQATEDELTKYSPIIDSYLRIYKDDVSKITSFPLIMNCAVTTYRRAIHELLMTNFSSIENFLKATYDQGTIQDIFEYAQTASTTATVSPWAIARDFKKNFKDKANIFIIEDHFDLRTLPSETLTLLLQAANCPYLLFARIFDAYYNSVFGQNTCEQKQSHFIDTYQSILVGTRDCFLEGLKFKS